MKERAKRIGDPATGFIPSAEYLRELKVGDLVPDCWGLWATLEEIRDRRRLGYDPARVKVGYRTGFGADGNGLMAWMTEGEMIGRFIDDPMPNTPRQMALAADWFCVNVKPEDVFGEDALIAWAEEHDEGQ